MSTVAWTCPNCGFTDNVRADLPVHCSCGQASNEQPTRPVADHRKRAREVFAICTSNECGHYGVHERHGKKCRGCGLMNRPCRLFDHLLTGGGCFADPPLFDASP